MIDVMVDLETLGTEPGSVVLSIGAVASGGPGTFSARLDMRESLFLGLTVNPDTMAWWRKQQPEAWAAATDGGIVLNVAAGLSAFSTWLQTLRASGEEQTGQKLRLWGDSASFDLGLLACVYRAAKLPQPWAYHEEHCYRTLRNLLNSEKPKAKLQHDALSDARAQMVHLQELLTKLAA